MTILSPLAPFVAQYDGQWFALKSNVTAQMFEQIYPRLIAHANRFIKLLEIDVSEAKILDLGCGSGVLDVILANQKYQMFAVDCSPSALSVAQKIADIANEKVHWIQADIRTFQTAQPMDYVLLWDVLFGICPTEEEDEQVIKNISNSLKSEGRCLLEVYNKEFALAHGVENLYFYNQYNQRFELKTQRHDLPIKSVKLYSHEEWQKLLEKYKMGIFKVEGIPLINDPPGPPWRTDYIVAQKY